MIGNDDKDLLDIELIGSNTLSLFKVHKNIPDKIRKDIGDEKKPYTTFLDRSTDRGVITMFAKNSFLMKELIAEDDYKRLLLAEDDELENGC